MRLSVVVGQYWPSMEAVIGVVMDGPKVSSGGWKDSRRIIYGQILVWYLFCGLDSRHFCNRGDLFRAGASATFRAYEDELVSMVDSVAAVCSDARAAPGSCELFVATHVYDGNPSTSLLAGITRNVLLTLPQGARTKSTLNS